MGHSRCLGPRTLADTEGQRFLESCSPLDKALFMKGEAVGASEGLGRPSPTAKNSHLCFPVVQGLPSVPRVWCWAQGGQAGCSGWGFDGGGGKEEREEQVQLRFQAPRGCRPSRHQ